MNLNERKEKGKGGERQKEARRRRWLEFASSPARLVFPLAPTGKEEGA
jgi:hypothetical protein